MKRICIVLKDKCNPSSCGYWCILKCPMNKEERDCIKKKSNKVAIEEKVCSGCGICTKCMFDAIKIINLPERLREPIHRYGKNAFELFSLPLPRKGILGIIGRNGIGKSTAFEILSGNLKPNLGGYEEEIEEKEIINRYSKSILGQYFKKLYNKEIKISYKPQRIELISKLYKGSINSLIKKIDERKISDKLLDELGMNEILNRDVSKLSGGELQKLAIIACLCKDADVYYFDEPMSFLDIMNRIKVIKLIRKYNEDKSTMIVEHDIASLDYISDEVCIVYGEQAGYGVFSQNKGVKRGINEYLNGYMSEENVRFRDYSIEFFENKGKEYREEALFEFPRLKKSFDVFSLEVNKGKVRKGEVLGVVGGNGLGKSTFLKLLNGELKPDKEKIKKINVSYKEQYIKALDGRVVDLLKEKAGNKFESGWYKQNILEKLGLGKLLNSEIKNLSGGELQKFHIALCLSSDNELIAMDEPSAFIDVEDRLKVAEIIKDFIIKEEKAAIIVDHDFQFIDYLADSLLVFEGVAGKIGKVIGVCEKKEGMNKVLKMLDVTYRKDKETGRRRINKEGSVLDREQRKKGEYYYV